MAATGRLRHFEAPPQSLVTERGYDPDAHPASGSFETWTTP
jgi:hypothetical protein